MSSNVKLHLGDCLDVLKETHDNSIDSIVTDPPYGISFMNKHWDYQVPSVDIWKECLRVLKPGGYLLSFAGTRTQHRMACNIEDAGFEIRDMIAWIYAQGMPKHKSCLKPALEPITLARKPSTKVQELNIDSCRVNFSDNDDPRIGKGYQHKAKAGIEIGTKDNSIGEVVHLYKEGRYPSNVIHDGSEEVLELFPDSKGQRGHVSDKQRTKNNCFGDTSDNGKQYIPRKDSGSAARFFFCAKANKKDRGEDNKHPTVKPTELMRYLCRLITPKDGIILDPFMGSGSTGKAAVLEGFNFVGIEMQEEYYNIADKRINEAKEN